MKHVEGDINKKIPSGEKKKRYNVLQMLKQTTTKNS